MAGGATIDVGVVLDGKYEITGVLGQGAMGVVYEAMHKRLQRKVALKTLGAGFADDAELVARFEREARAASAIGHPNIVQVFDAAGDPQPYLVMELLEGQSLGELLSTAGRLEPSRAVALCQQCLLGLGAAHQAGIVHRDLKPDNIFITGATGAGEIDSGEVVKILDFGISKILQGSAGEKGYDGRATQAGMIMGTPLYMSPEQATGRADIDQRSDLWSMACVLYECLAGQPPFQGDNHNQIMAAVLKGQFVSLQERCPDVSSGLSAVIDKALSADANQRFTDAASMGEALQNCDATSAGDAAPDLAAFDNLADRFLAQEAEDSRESALPATPRDPGTPVPRDERFAPPMSNEPIALALDVEGPPRRRRESPGGAKAARPTKRKKSEWVTRDEPSRIGSSILKFVLLVSLMAGAAAGYRYYKFGYVLPKPPPPLATLRVQAVPASAALLVDGRRQDARTVELAGGTPATIALLSDGYVSMRASLTLQAGQSALVSAQLGHQLPVIDNALPGDPVWSASEPAVLSAEQVQAGYEKVAALVDCGARLSNALQEALPTKEDGDPTPISYALADECRLMINIHAAKEPAMESLDVAATALVASIEALNEALRNHKASTGASSKVRREMRTTVQRASSTARRTRTAFLVAMNQGLSRWLSEDAQRVRSREGDSMHAFLRDLMVASDAWSRANLAGAKSARALHTALVEAHERANNHAAQHGELYKQSGGLRLLGAIAPLVGDDPGEQALLRHNQAVLLFNQLQLPLAVASR